MKKDMIDYHCHLLPALDDGATDREESLKMAGILSRFGFSTVHCTPHRIKGCYENTPPRVTKTTHSLQRLLDEAGIELRLIPGGEHYLDEFLPDQLPGAMAFGPYRCLLVEVPFGSGSEMLKPMVSCFSEHGLTPLIAHPERCRAFEPVVREQGLRGALSFVLGRNKAEDPDCSALLTLRKAGCRFQGNLGSFAGFYGSEIKERALLFLKEGVYSCLGSDAHRSEHLSKMLTAGFEAVVSAVGDEAAMRLLCGSDLENA